MFERGFTHRTEVTVAAFILALLAAVALPRAAEVRGERFTWKDGRICDRGRQIAEFNVDNLAFSGVILKPGGPVMIDRWTVYWSLGTRWKTIHKDRFSADDSNPGCLKLHVVSHSDGEHHLSKTDISVAYDESLASYVYEVQTEFGTNRYNREPELRLPPRDFARIVFREAQAPYEYYVCQGRPGNWLKVPLGYLLSPDKFDICFKRGHAVSALWSATTRHVPVVELTGLTPHNDCSACVRTWPSVNVVLQKARTVIRPWGYLKEPASYKVYCCDRARLENVVPTAEARQYSPEEIQAYDRPGFQLQGVNDFEQGAGLQQTTRSAFWTSVGDLGQTQWCKETGYRGAASLKCGDADKAVDCRWEIAPPGLGPKLLSGKAYLLSAYAKTVNLEGDGAFVSLVAGRGSNPISSQKLTGNNQWRNLKVRIPAGNDPRIAQIRLHHKGKGISYFDCVKLEPVAPDRPQQQ